MPSDKSSEKSSHVDPPASVIDQSRRTGAAPLGHPITPISPTSSSSITNDDSHLSPQPISSTSHASRPQSVQSLSSTISHASSSSVSLPTTVSPGRTRRPSDDSLATDTTSELETGIEGVAPKRQIEFERNFAETIRQSNQSDDVDAIRVVMTRAADLQRKLLIHGRLYLTKTHLCFHSNILGIKTDNTLVLKDIISIEKGTTAGLIRNAINITLFDGDGDGDGEGEGDGGQEKRYDYGSILDRDGIYDKLVEFWKVEAPERYDVQLGQGQAANLLESDVVAPSPVSGPVVTKDEPSNTVAITADEPSGVVKNTHCSGEHFEEIAIDTNFPFSPNQLFDLIYHNQSFLLEFYGKDEGLTGEFNLGSVIHLLTLFR